MFLFLISSLVLPLLHTLAHDGNQPSTQLKDENSDCPAGWINAQYLGCFKFLPQDSTGSWLDAQQLCELQGGYLAEPKTVEQMEFLTGLAVMEEMYTDLSRWWIGLSDLGHEGVWAWIHSVEVVGDTFWDAHSPSHDTNKDCVLMGLSMGQLGWRDYDCLAMSVEGSLIAPVCQMDINTGTTTPTTPGTPTAGPDCPPGWSAYKQTCFRASNGTASWQEANLECEELSGQLASVHGEEEFSFLTGLAEEEGSEGPNSHNVWLGGSDSASEGEWVWVDGSEWDYQYGVFVTDGGQARNCLSFYTANSHWISRECNLPFSYICQIRY